MISATIKVGEIDRLGGPSGLAGHGEPKLVTELMLDSLSGCSKMMCESLHLVYRDEPAGLANLSRQTTCGGQKLSSECPFDLCLPGL
jgi:hypothetical protein